jgi:ubiquinone/menaquinone biosynthesis C-methylase UbiE
MRDASSAGSVAVPPGVPRRVRAAEISAWRGLYRHSLRLGGGWLLRGWRHRWRGARVGLCRLAVPMDPWRYWELGRIAGERFGDRILDVSSPKLLASYMSRIGAGEWVCVDLFDAEIDNWREVDPTLDLRVEDARRLSFPDSSFDACVCVSVVEHIPDDGDIEAMAEMWRVLRPGGVLCLTTMIERHARDEFIDRKIYGAASEQVGGRVFYSRYYDETTIRSRLLHQPWRVEQVERARQVNKTVQRRFVDWRPWSYALGCALRWRCPGNFALVAAADALEDGEEGIMYLVLRKPVDDGGDRSPSHDDRTDHLPH